VVELAQAMCTAFVALTLYSLLKHVNRTAALALASRSS
jgi:hypothetical protein